MGDLACGAFRGSWGVMRDVGILGFMGDREGLLVFGLMGNSKGLMDYGGTGGLWETW